MNKFLLITFLLATTAFAENFEQFLNRAVQSSPYLKSSALSTKQVKEEGKILSRYENPTLEMEYSSFQPDLGSSDNGYRLSYSQPIRLWGVAGDKSALTQANMQSADASYMQKRALFVRDISLLYTQYAQTKKLLILGKEELKIAQKIYDISLARFESGSISEGLKLQAQVDFEMIETLQEKLTLSSTNSYFRLLGFAGVNEEVELEESYEFSLENERETLANPRLKVYETEKNRALKEAQLNTNSIEWVNLFAELENEPNQDIYRVGVNIPLAIFSDKSQEKNIATLKARQAKLLMQNQKSSLTMKLLRLQKERKMLLKLNKKSQEILKTQLKLLNMYEDGYKIANTSLLQLQDIKNKVVQTKRQIIQTEMALHKNAIQTNYNRGNYNE